MDVRGGGNWQTESSKTYRIYKERKKIPLIKVVNIFRFFFFFLLLIRSIRDTALRFKEDGEQGGGVWANRFPTKRDYYL